MNVTELLFIASMITLIVGFVGVVMIIVLGVMDLLHIQLRVQVDRKRYLRNVVILLVAGGLLSTAYLMMK
ncbi:hypothetical protein C8U37_11329 [Trichococcus patagoniensis]|uniref:Uncharacterized protein n=1 Tax=Trichococcus patagoniensis TaxID=382641 RepID=A0A2T5IIK1_9LACT|nr:hypothetical protein [Trichococcus patagoniensis]PTQ83619.1 hypothetical protein C8U37_11329 [Trichococcus patagoniensis]